MYTVQLDNALLYDPRVDDLKILDARIKLEVNKVGSFDFTIYPTHPLYGAIQKLKSTVEVYQDSVLIFRGRVLSDTVGFYQNKDITCEGDLAFFNDTIMRPYAYEGSVVGFIQSIIDSHNAQVEAEKQFTLGTLTVTDPNDYIVRSSIEYEKTWDVINDKLLDLLGGYIMVRRQGGVNYIDYLEDSEYMSTQAIELGVNLLDTIKETRADEIITALIPLGAKLEDQEGNETDERLTIAAINGGLDYVHDEAAVAQYGWIFATETWDDVTEATNLLTKANAKLATLVNLGVSIDLRAIDLSMVDISIDELRIFEYVQITSAPHGLDTMARIDKLELNLLNPQKNTVTLGFGYDTFTEKQVQTDKAIRQIQADYVTNQTVGAIREDQLVLESLIAQTPELIMTQVSQQYVKTDEYGTYKQTIQTQMENDATGWNYQFTTLEQMLQTIDGDTTAQFNEIVKYIRFIDGNIILGEVGNEITLTIENDRISFKQNGAEVAYFSNNKLNVTDGQFINSLQVGNFAFIPRANGSLDFKKVG